MTILICRPAQDSVPDVVVTGGEQKGVTLRSSEVLCIQTLKWNSFPDLTFPLESHVQTDQSQPVVLGGLQTGSAPSTAAARSVIIGSGPERLAISAPSVVPPGMLGSPLPGGLPGLPG